MGNGMNKILPGLYLGNFRDSKDQQQLTENNITHIVAAHDNATALLQGFQYHCINAADSVDQDLSQYFGDCAMFIHKARSEGGNVLIHCMAGISRSTTLATAYIRTVTEMNWKEIIKCIKCSRSVANPNSGFQRQLNEFGQSRELEMLKRKIKEQYSTKSFDDEHFLRQLYVNTSESQAKLSDEYEEDMNTVAKYSSTGSNRNRIFCIGSTETNDNPSDVLQER